MIATLRLKNGGFGGILGRDRGWIRAARSERPSGVATLRDDSGIQLAKKTSRHEGCNNIDISFRIRKM